MHLQEVGISVFTAEELLTHSPPPTDSRKQPAPHTVNQSPRNRPAPAVRTDALGRTREYKFVSQNPWTQGSISLNLHFPLARYLTSGVKMQFSPEHAARGVLQAPDSRRLAGSVPSFPGSLSALASRQTANQLHTLVRGVLSISALQPASTPVLHPGSFRTQPVPLT